MLNAAASHGPADDDRCCVGIVDCHRDTRHRCRLFTENVDTVALDGAVVDVDRPMPPYALASLVDRSTSAQPSGFLRMSCRTPLQTPGLIFESPGEADAPPAATTRT